MDCESFVMSGQQVPNVLTRKKLPEMQPRLIVWGLLLLAAALRLPGLWTDFWLDEIWSWTLVWNWKLQPQISGIWGIFTQIHQDNNNYLNTLFLYLCGPLAPLAVYRIPAFVAGLVTVWLGGLLAVRWSQGRGVTEFAGLLAGMGLLATSQIEVVYSSEARGYAIAGCAALAAQWSMGTLLRSGKWSSAASYAFISCAGFLGHLSFLPVLISQVVWSLVVLSERRHPAGSWKVLCGKLTVACGIPALLVGWLWLVDLSQTKVGGGPELDTWLVACDTFSMPFGASLPEDYSLPCALLMFALLATGLRSLRHDSTREYAGLASLAFIAPTVMFGLAPDGLVYPRHFLVSLTLLMPVAGLGLLQWLTAERPLFRLAGILAIGIWCLGNGSELTRFWIAGRGQYQAALAHIEAATQGQLTAVGSDFDFRNATVMTFYQVRSPERYRSLRYIPQAVWNQYRPDWLLAHSQSREPHFDKEIQILDATYDLNGIFPYAGPVGWHWATYRRRP